MLKTTVTGPLAQSSFSFLFAWFPLWLSGVALYLCDAKRMTDVADLEAEPYHAKPFIFSFSKHFIYPKNSAAKQALALSPFY
jgi:hypothetical protein